MCLNIHVYVCTAMQCNEMYWNGMYCITCVYIYAYRNADLNIGIYIYMCIYRERVGGDPRNQEGSGFGRHLLAMLMGSPTTTPPQYKNPFSSP